MSTIPTWAVLSEGELWEWFQARLADGLAAAGLCHIRERWPEYFADLMADAELWQALESA